MCVHGTGRQNKDNTVIRKGKATNSTSKRSHAWFHTYMHICLYIYKYTFACMYMGFRWEGKKDGASPSLLTRFAAQWAACVVCLVTQNTNISAWCEANQQWYGGPFLKWKKRMSNLRLCDAQSEKVSPIIALHESSILGYFPYFLANELSYCSSLHNSL